MNHFLIEESQTADNLYGLVGVVLIYSQKSRVIEGYTYTERTTHE